MTGNASTESTPLDGLVHAINMDALGPKSRWDRFGDAAYEVRERLLDLLPHRYRIERALEPLHLRRHARNAWQRARRGYSNEDTYSFEDYLANVIIGGLTELRNRELAHPGGLDPEEWRAILDEIIIGFRTFLDDEKRFSDDAEVRAKIDRGWELFREWFPSLWD